MLVSVHKLTALLQDVKMSQGRACRFGRDPESVSQGGVTLSEFVLCFFFF